MSCSFWYQGSGKSLRKPNGAGAAAWIWSGTSPQCQSTTCRELQKVCGSLGLSQSRWTLTGASFPARRCFYTTLNPTGFVVPTIAFLATVSGSGIQIRPSFGGRKARGNQCPRFCFGCVMQTKRRRHPSRALQSKGSVLPLIGENEETGFQLPLEWQRGKKGGKWDDKKGKKKGERGEKEKGRNGKKEKGKGKWSVNSYGF